MNIVATSQQSRFHTEACQTLSTDVDLKQVNISVGDKEILVDAHLKLNPGVHYGLIGRNGIGKSTLLKSIGFRLLTGLPNYLRILYVDQLEDASLSERSVLENVLAAHREAVTLQKSSDLLQRSLDGGMPDDIVEAVKDVAILTLEEEFAVAHEIATKRSGQRGVEARAYLVDVEKRLDKARADRLREESTAEIASAIEVAETMLANLTTRLEQLDIDTAEPRARKLLKGLGFTNARIDGPLSQLSGGWKTRVALAQALFIQPDLLLLDEPTNNLDLPAILWLQNYLCELAETTVVVISHDRAFLNATVEKIILLRHKTLTYYDGNYDEYEETVGDVRVHQARVRDSLVKKKEHLQKTIQQQVHQARSSKDDKKMSQAASKKKKLERLGVETNAKGHKFKLNRDRPGYYNTVRDDAFVDEPDKEISWSFPHPLELKSPGALVVLENVSFGYKPVSNTENVPETVNIPQQKPALSSKPVLAIPGTKRIVIEDTRAKSAVGSLEMKQGKTMVVRNVSLSVQQNARIALVGKNGQGKTTLLNILADKVIPDTGSVARHPQAKVGYFLQNHIQEINAVSNKCALAMLKEMKPDSSEQIVRAHLAGFGLQGSVVLQPLSSLSGGQAVRLAMAKAMAHKPQLLLLDEPTNHLDMETINAMVENIKSFPGAIVLVSHDQYLVSSVAEDIYEVHKGQLLKLPGGMKDYAQKARMTHK